MLESRRSLTVARLKTLLTYWPLSGHFVHNECGRRTDLHRQIAGHLREDGYRIIKLDGEKYRASHIAWLYMTGKWPKDEIDHANKNPSDDRWVNLREASSADNKYNKDGWRKKEQYKGVYVYLNKKKQRWRAAAMVQNKNYHLGIFDTPEEAAVAYDTFAEKMHGKFARLNFPKQPIERDWLFV